MGTADKRTYPELWQTLVQKFGPHRAADCCPDVAPANAFIGDYLRLELLYLDGQTEKLLQEIFSRHLGDSSISGEAMTAFESRMEEFIRLSQVLERSEQSVQEQASEINALQAK